MGEKVIKIPLAFTDPVIGIEPHIIDTKIFDDIIKQNNEIILGLSKDLFLPLDSIKLSENILKNIIITLPEISLPKISVPYMSFLNDNIREYIKEIQKIQSDEDYKKLPFYFALYFPNDFWSDVRELWLIGKKEEVMNLTYKYSIENSVMNDFKKEILKNQYFIDNEQCLNQALEAHTQGKFYLSVPLLYSLLEGFGLVVLPIKHEDINNLDRYSKCKKCDKVIDICPHCNEKLEQPNITIGRITGNLKNKFFDNEADKEIFIYINKDYSDSRNAIIHGRNFNECNFKTSTKLLFFIFVLSDYINVDK